MAASGTFTVTHEGPPGCVHGGAIAAGFEHVAERAETLAGLEPGPRTVTIRYRRPTLLGIPLRFEADPPVPGTGDDASGAVVVSARLVQDGEVTCEARAERPRFIIRRNASFGSPCSISSSPMACRRASASRSGTAWVPSHRE